MKIYIAILLLLAASASAQITAKYQHSDQTVKIYSQAGHVWLYNIDGKDITAGYDEFNVLAAGKPIHWEKACKELVKSLNKSGNVDKDGKIKIKLKKKNGLTVLEYTKLDQATLLGLLKDGYLVEQDKPSGNGNGKK